MQLTKEHVQKYNSRILFSRLRILQKYGFYGILLMHAKFGLDLECNTAYTDGSKICFNPVFMDLLSDEELDFIMMHEIMHIVLRHCFRDGDRDPDKFNIACDIVVNSNILYSADLNLKAITLKEFGESMHLAPNGLEGYNYTAEEVYEMLQKESVSKKTKDGKKGKGNSSSSNSIGNDNDNESFDDHTKWSKKKDDDSDKEEQEDWNQKLISAVKSAEDREKLGGCGKVPLIAQRIVGELLNPQIDWKVILNDFIQEEICDYSFNPPDRRFSDSPFFLPDFNGTEIVVQDVLFMVDTSGSINNEDITKAYSEIKGAIDQFDGKLSGKLGFFDVEVTDPIDFSSVTDLLNIKPYGGGGTSFFVIFEYIFNNMESLPATIIILTDGCAEFPDESIARGIPVLWLINNDQVTPPWGKIARIK